MASVIQPTTWDKNFLTIWWQINKSVCHADVMSGVPKRCHPMRAAVRQYELS
jgi:hypothetical protein